MSDRGIYGMITDGVNQLGECLIVGHSIPRMHHTDSLPVYLVIEHKLGFPMHCRDGKVKKLLTYPSHWAAPAQQHYNRWIFARHELLRWSGFVPCFDLQAGVYGQELPKRENVTEIVDRLRLPLPPRF